MKNTTTPSCWRIKGPELTEPTVLGLFFDDDSPDADAAFAVLVEEMLAVRRPKPGEEIVVRAVDGLGEDVYAVYYDEHREAA